MTAPASRLSLRSILTILSVGNCAMMEPLASLTKWEKGWPTGHCGGRVAKKCNQRKKNFKTLAQTLHDIVQKWMMHLNAFVAEVAFSVVQK